MSISALFTRLKKRLQSWGVFEYLTLFIVLIASFLRLWKLPTTLMFQGDQGRDAIIVADIFRHADLVFIGPVTSVGNMYLGPLYYYFMMPFLRLSYPSPVGPAYAIALLGILTTFLLYYLGKNIVGKIAALIAALFFALSATVLTYSRFSWNPNPAPLFGFLMLWSTYKAWTKNAWYWLLVSVCFSVLVQLHYLTLLALPAAGLIWLIQAYMLFIRDKASVKKKKKFIFATLGAVFLFLASLAPLALFDYKHDWLNSRAFLDLVTNRETIGGELSGVTKLTTTLKETHGRSMHILFDLFIGQDRTRNSALVILTLLGLGGLIKTSSGLRQKGYIVIAVYTFVAIIGTAFYQHTLFDHYLGYMYAVVCLVYGGIFGFMLKNKVGLGIFLIFISYYLWYNVPRYPIWITGWTIYDMERIADIVTEHVGPNEPYNIILLSESKDLYGQNYRYFLTTSEKPPVKPEQFAQANKLFIINENQKGVDVTQLPIYEIQTFPNKAITSVYTGEYGPDILMMER